MKNSNLIITFANQKGGVGKSTLCAMFATYVASLGYPVKVIDCDGQTSIAQLRAKELSSQEPDSTTNVAPFDIDVHRLTDHKSTQAMIPSLVNFEGVVMVDAPGNLNEAGLVPILANSDFIVCPFTLDKISITSTAVFVVLITRLKSTIGAACRTKTIYVPNRVDGRVGTSAEKRKISATKLHLSHYGDVSPEIGLRACMQRVSTMELSEEQSETVNEAFSFIARSMGLTEEDAAGAAFGAEEHSLTTSDSDHEQGDYHTDNA